MEDKKRILVVNDDGIGAEGIRRLAQMAKNFGEVWVVAPDAQCSAMSQRITVRGDLVVKSVDFPVEGVHAYSVSGTPGGLRQGGILLCAAGKAGCVVFRDQRRIQCGT